MVKVALAVKENRYCSLGGIPDNHRRSYGSPLVAWAVAQEAAGGGRFPCFGGSARATVAQPRAAVTDRSTSRYFASAVDRGDDYPKLRPAVRVAFGARGLVPSLQAKS